MLLIFLIEIANVWRARVELENALEASALAAVKAWKEGSTDAQARAIAITYAGANTVTGTPVSISPNGGGAGVNGNALATGNLIFGAVTTSAIPWAFDGSTAPDCGAGRDFGVRAQATVQVNSVAAGLGGYDVPVLWVSATATARCACGVGTQPQLIRVRPENVFY
jgi:Flp pilus assembly protein TadG